MGPDLNMPDEGLLGGTLKKANGKSYEKGNRTEEALKVQLERRKHILDIDRQTWRPNWMDLGAHFRPYRGRWLIDGNDTNKGWRRNWQIVDSTPLIAVNTVAAGIQAGATSPARPWFTYALEDDDMMEAPGVKEWMDLATKKARAILNKSNFYNSAFECYGEFPVFGMLAMSREWPIEDDLPHFQPFTIGSYYVANDKNRRVNVFFRDFKWTVQQVVEKFTTGPLDEEASWKNISVRTRTLWNNQQWDAWVDLTHAVYENIERVKADSGVYKADYRGMRFRSVYYERGGDPERILKDSDQEDKKKTLRIGGFRSFPVFVARWYTNSEDAWGRGPAMDALGDARALQLQQKRKAQGIDKHVDPPMRAHPSLRNQRTSSLPGDVTFVTPEQGHIGFEPVYEVKPDLQWMGADIKETQQRIREMLFADLFSMFIRAEEQSQPITAAEVNAKQQEKLLMLGPVLEQMNYDFLNPLHEWLFAEMLRHGVLPPMPPAMQGQAVHVTYTSILAQAINAVTVGAIQQFTGFVTQVAQLEGQQNPALDKVDVDKMIEEFAKATGVPPACVRPDSDVEQIRQVRQKQQEEQQQQEAMQARAATLAQHADTAQSLSQTPAGNGSALDVLAGAVGAGQVPNR